MATRFDLLLGYWGDSSYNPINTFEMDGQYSPRSTAISLESSPDTMISFLSFITLAFTGMVVVSVGIDVDIRALRVESNLKKRFVTNTCSDPDQAEFVSDS
jgi:hypothetical protein